MAFKDDLTNNIIDSVEDFFTTNLFVRADVVDKDECSDQQCLCSSIRLEGAIEGNIDVWLTSSSASALVSKMIGVDIDENSDEIEDGIGEVINMVAGGLKTRLAQKGYDFNISPPTAQRDNMLRIAYQDKIEEAKVCFACDDIKFKIMAEFVVNEEVNKGEDTAAKIDSAADMLSKLLGAAAAPQAEAAKEEEKPAEQALPTESPQQEQTQQEAVSQEIPATDHSQSVLKGKSVIVIHEDESKRNAIKNILQQESIENMLFTKTQAEGLESIQQDNSEFVIVDYFLNKEMGLETCKQIKDRFPEKKVLLVVYKNSLLLESQKDEYKFDQLYPDCNGYDQLADALKSMI